MEIIRLENKFEKYLSCKQIEQIIVVGKFNNFIPYIHEKRKKPIPRRGMGDKIDDFIFTVLPLF